MGIFGRIKGFIDRIEEFGKAEPDYEIDDTQDEPDEPIEGPHAHAGLIRLNTVFDSFDREASPSAGDLVIDPYGAVPASVFEGDAAFEGALPMRLNPLDLVPDHDVEAAGDMAYRVAECAVPNKDICITGFHGDGIGHDRVLLAALIQWMALTWEKGEGFRNLSDLGRIVRHKALVDALVTGGPLPPPRDPRGDRLLDDLAGRDVDWHAPRWTEQPTWVSQATDLLADEGARTLAYARLTAALDFLGERSVGYAVADTDVDVEAVRNSDVYLYMPREVVRDDERYRLARFWLALVAMIRE